MMRITGIATMARAGLQTLPTSPTIFYKAPVGSRVFVSNVIATWSATSGSAMTLTTSAIIIYKLAAAPGTNVGDTFVHDVGKIVAIVDMYTLTTLPYRGPMIQLNEGEFLGWKRIAGADIRGMINITGMLASVQGQ